MESPKHINLKAITIGFLLLIPFLQIAACKHESQIGPPADSGYPEQIATIMKKCSNAGCHNDQSKEGAGGLSLSTWNDMFEGGSGGAVTVPYATKYSTLLYYTNIDTSKGLTLLPTMPYNAVPLSPAEYDLLVTWIQNGAPDKNGYVKFSDYKDRTKLYIANKGCDVVTVMDAETGIAMRYINVGLTAEIEGPSVVKVSPDKKYWYVAFSNGTIIQKFSTADNTLIGQAEVGLGAWSSMTITGDSKKAFLTDNQYLGRVTCLDLERMQEISAYTADMKYPLNACLDAAQNKLYVTSAEGNYMYKIDVSDVRNMQTQRISLEPDKPVDENPSLNPYAILFSPDHQKYFVSCKRSAELRIYKTSNDSLIAVLPVGSNPGKLYASSSSPYLFLGCMGAPGTAKLSTVYVFNYETNTLVKDIYAGHESRGFAFDELSAKLYVANRNASAGGPAAHHGSVCAGKNGYMTAIDMHTLELVKGYKKEISVDPYDVDLVK